jgi:hypothetical protein
MQATGIKKENKQKKVSHFLFHQITNDWDHLWPELWTGMTSSCLPRQPKEKRKQILFIVSYNKNIKDKRNKIFNIPKCLPD